LTLFAKRWRNLPISRMTAAVNELDSFHFARSSCILQTPEPLPFLNPIHPP
jgi:hypothetical protein